MGSKSSASLALFLVFNLLFFTLVVGSNSGSGSGSCGICPSPRPRPNPTPNPSPNPSSSRNRCPVDALKLGVCANVLAPLLGITIGTPPRTPCCSLIGNLVDLEAALCLCIAIRANILGINLNIPLSLSLLLNFCGQNVPRGFQCPN